MGKPLKGKTCAVVVLGDLGHSPRMQYHTISLLEEGCKVDLFGYHDQEERAKVGFLELFTLIHAESSLREEITSSPNATVKPLSKMAPKLPKIFYIFLAPIKFFYLLTQLWLSLCAQPYDFILVQNPPSLPTLAVCLYAAWRSGGQCIVDWHNFGHSILALNVGERHPLVPLYRFYERYFGSRAHQHWTVTEAMKSDLSSSPYSISGPIRVHYDRPPPFFHRLSAAERQSFFETDLPTAKCFYSSTGKAFPFEQFLSSSPPALLVSGTSWTPDEDFSLLLSALVEFDRLIAENQKYPNLVVVITGPQSGPLRQHYEEEMAKLQLRKCSIFTMWLHISHYPRLLGVADLGVSLHQSSSGVDLPMKVVDMFGCRLPVCSRRYRCIEELVQESVNGELFDNSAELASQLVELFGDWPSKTKLNRLASNIHITSWHESWKKDCLPSFVGKKQR